MFDEERIRQYLSLGFVPDAERASDYLDQLFAGTPQQHKDPTRLLVEIVQDLTAGSSKVAIPLSGGKDSRALFGAALDLYSAAQIQCFTFGPEASADVKGARRACRRAGVVHHVLQPDSLKWDIDALTNGMARRLEDGVGIPPIDGIAIFSSLSAMIGEDMPVLSGYLGVAANGKHLGGGALDEDHDQVLARFYRQNRGVLADRPDNVFREFLGLKRSLRDRWEGLTNFDLLDFGFRQRLRIRSSVTCGFARPIRPFEDRRWISHWFSQPVRARIEQASFDAALSRAFPTVFGAPTLGGRIGDWLARGRRHSRQGDAGSWIADRGDVRRNASMAAALEEACRSFDERGIASGELSAAAAFQQLLREPTKTAFRQVRWFATAEIVLRAQEQASAPQ